MIDLKPANDNYAGVIPRLDRILHPYKSVGYSDRNKARDITAGVGVLYFGANKNPEQTVEELRLLYPSLHGEAEGMLNKIVVGANRLFNLNEAYKNAESFPTPQYI